MKKNQPGCPCCHGHGHGCVTTICVTGCGIPIIGVTVTVLSGGTTVATGLTTSPTGCVTFAIPAAGTYTVTVTGVPAGFSNFSGSKSLACLGTTTIALSLASGFSCCACPPCSIPNIPLTLSDGFGDVTMTPIGCGWGGCAMRTVHGQCSVDSSCTTGSQVYGDFDVPVQFQFACFEIFSTFLWGVAAIVPACISGGAWMRGFDCSYSFFGPATANLFVSSMNWGPAISCSPFDWTGTVPDFCSMGVCGASVGIPPCLPHSPNSTCGIYGCGDVMLTVTA